MGILQLVGQPQARQGVRPRAGAPAGFPNLLTSPPRSNPANRPGPQTMPECRFNKYNATSTLLKRTALVAGALTAIVLTAGLFPLSLVGWRWSPKPSGLGGAGSS